MASTQRESTDELQDLQSVWRAYCIRHIWMASHQCECVGVSSIFRQARNIYFKIAT
jgi:hypothetical protein